MLQPHRFWCSLLCSTGCWYNLAIIESLWSGKEDCLTGQPRWRSLWKDSVKWESGDAPNEEQVVTAGWQQVECKPRRVVSLVVLESLSRVWLLRPPWTIARQALLSIGLTRKEYWSGLPCLLPEDLPTPRITLESLLSPASASRFFTTSTTREANVLEQWKPHRSKREDSHEIFGTVTNTYLGVRFLVTSTSAASVLFARTL